MKRAPGAPRRFRSAYILFSSWIKKQLSEEGTPNEKMVNIAKIVSEAWKNLSPTERRSWEEKANQDKRRFQLEKSKYKGPWRVEHSIRRRKKDPTAPKRPMSAYLSFANSKRSAVQENHPNISNADVSRLLAKMWREAPHDVKQKYINEELKLREKYKAEIAAWRLDRDAALTTSSGKSKSLDLAGGSLQRPIHKQEGDDESPAAPFAAKSHNSSSDSDADSSNLFHHQEASSLSDFDSSRTDTPFSGDGDDPENDMEPITLFEASDSESLLDTVDDERKHQATSHFESMEEEDTWSIDSKTQHENPLSLSENERATSPSFLNLRMTRIENMMDEESRNNNADTNQQNVEFTLFLERFLQDTLSDDSEVMKNEPLFVGDFPLDDLFDDI
eukprot:CAMPEP_0116832786 /NCGR_PEP_ID=MMETSP0418-20121206/6082_1 /TAXON_ID=1158023 /ORGANISM="Astrosyne radiata, Strain 13vi08-1A" /LENGTH=388 /DNA_ID=CAMNT_0004462179 /DNA_START=54 /DNA_END=1220 /DNA_ORIENTATION=+